MQPMQSLRPTTRRGIVIAILAVLAACLPGARQPRGASAVAGSSGRPRRAGERCGVRRRLRRASGCRARGERGHAPLQPPDATARSGRPGGGGVSGAHRDRGRTCPPRRLAMAGNERPGVRPRRAPPERDLVRRDGACGDARALGRGARGAVHDGVLHAAAPGRRPAAVERRHAPRAGADFEVRFDQAVDPREVERVTTLTVGKGRRIALRASRPEPQNTKLVKLTPAAPLPLATPVELTLGASLHGTDGPLPMGEDKVTSHGDVRAAERGGVVQRDSGPQVRAGRRVHRSTCRTPCPWRRSARTSRVSPQEAMEWAPLEAGENSSGSFAIPVRLLAGKSYRVRVAAGLRDEYGQTLDRDVTRDVVVDDLPPTLSMGLERHGHRGATRPGARGTRDLGEPRWLRAGGAGLDERDVARMTRAGSGALNELPAASWQKIAPVAGRNRVAITTSPPSRCWPVTAAAARSFSPPGGRGARRSTRRRARRFTSAT